MLNFTTPPFPVSAGVRFVQALPYGDDPQQVMDVFLPTSATPTAAVVFYHGGGFVAGDRTNGYSMNGANVKQLTDANIAWFGVDYRLLRTDGTEDQGVLKPLSDNKRALQFIRRWAATFNLDPARVGVYGGSAGAGTSLWLGYHDDMAIPDAGDPVDRQSTRVSVLCALTTQSTYDVLRWTDDVYAGEYPALTNEVLLGNATLREKIVRFYGLPASLQADGGALWDVLHQPAYVAYRQEVDMLGLLTPDDPPTYLLNTNADVAPTMAGFDILHHPLHAMTVRAFASDAGLEHQETIPAYSVDTSDGGAMEFLINHLQ